MFRSLSFFPSFFSCVWFSLFYMDMSFRSKLYSTISSLFLKLFTEFLIFRYFILSFKVWIIFNWVQISVKIIHLLILVCCGSWGHKESDTTERLNWTELGECCSWCSTVGTPKHCSLSCFTVVSLLFSLSSLCFVRFLVCQHLSTFFFSRVHIMENESIWYVTLQPGQ